MKCKSMIFLLAMALSVQIARGQLSDDYINYTVPSVVPPAPETANLGEYGNLPMNESSGKANLSIPIHTISIDGIQVPISLSYNFSGVMVDGIASSVGLNWILNAGGSVYRTINGIADDDASGILNYPNIEGFIDQIKNYEDPEFPTENWQLLSFLSRNYVDLQYDNFGYVFPGGSGEFFISSSKEIQKSVDDNLLIKPFFDQIVGVQDGAYYSQTNAHHSFLNPSPKLFYFEIVDARGIKYTFREREQNGTFNPVNFKKDCIDCASEIPNQAAGTAGWKLSSIKSRNNKNVLFSYESYDMNYDRVIYGQTTHTFYAEDCKGSPDKSSVSYYRSRNKLIKEIKSSDNKVKVLFTYETIPTLNEWQRRLRSIKIEDQLQLVSKEFIFNYTCTNNSQKLLLESIDLKGSDGSIQPYYKFDYYNISFPESGSNAKDVFGFYNGAQNDKLFPLLPTDFSLSEIDREINEDFISSASLKEIHYPTGGWTRFFYEANKEGLFCAPGIRINKLIDYSHEEKEYNVKEFTYENLSGNVQHKNDYSAFKHTLAEQIPGPICIENTVYAFPSYPYRKSSSFYYKKVIIENKSYDPPSNSYKRKGKTIKQFIGQASDNNIQPVISSIEYHKIDENNQSSLVKRERFEYETQSLMCNKLGLKLKDQYRILIAIVQKKLIWAINFAGFHWQHWRSHSPGLLKKKITEEYFDGQCMTHITNYEYDSNYLPIREEYQIDENERFVKNNFYPEHSAFSGHENMISFPSKVEKKKLKSDKNQLLVDGIKYEYASNGNIVKTEKAINNSYRLENELSYLPNSSKIIQLTSRSNPVQSFVWSYENSLPSAKILNAEYIEVFLDDFEGYNDVNEKYFSKTPGATISSQDSYTGSHALRIPAADAGTIRLEVLKNDFRLKANKTYTFSCWFNTQNSNKVFVKVIDQYGKTLGSLEKQGNTYWSYAEFSFENSREQGNVKIEISNHLSGRGYILLDDIRFSPSDAQISSYQYDLTKGVEVITDPNRIKTHYDYDSFGRLASIRNNDKQLLKEYSYHLRNDLNDYIPDIETNLNHLSFPNTGNIKHLSISSNVSWKISSHPGWIRPGVTEGRGNQQIIFYCQYNNNNYSRSGKILIEGDGFTKELNVSQEGSYLTLSKSSLSYTSSQASQLITVNSNLNWKIFNKPSWLSTSVSSGSGNANVSINVQQNNGAARSANLKFVSGNHTKQVYIYQHAARSLSVNRSSVLFNTSGGISNVSVSSDRNWTVSKNQPWINVRPLSSNSNGTISIICSKNTGSQRSGIIYINDGLKTIQISVIQEGRLNIFR